jgi:hypothetical protein
MQTFLPEDPTKSFLESSLQKNLTDLDVISKNLRDRLSFKPNEESTRTKDNAPPVENPKAVTSKDDFSQAEECDTYTVTSPRSPVSMTVLQNNIADNLEALRRMTLGTVHNSQPVHPPQHSPSSSTSSDQVPRSLLPQQLPHPQLLPHPPGPLSLPDLGSDIDWADVLNTDTSRVGPEGGNTEMEVVSVSRPKDKE